MKGIVFMSVVVAGLLLSLAGYAAVEAPVDVKQKLAAAYFEAIFAGNVEQANKLIDVPFSFDRKEVLKTREEVEAMHGKIAADKGKRIVPSYAIEITDKAPKLDEAVFAKYLAYRITVTVPGKERSQFIDIYIRDTESPKVIGFSD